MFWPGNGPMFLQRLVPTEASDLQTPDSDPKVGSMYRMFMWPGMGPRPMMRTISSPEAADLDSTIQGTAMGGPMIYRWPGLGPNMCMNFNPKGYVQKVNPDSDPDSGSKAKIWMWPGQGPRPMQRFAAGTVQINNAGTYGMLSGQTLDLNGSVLPLCKVMVFSTLTNTLITTTYSDGMGNYVANVMGSKPPYYIVCYLVGPPDIAGTSVNTLLAN
jgi:hypothetical protein